jgi:hypothetical protein
MRILRLIIKLSIILRLEGADMMKYAAGSRIVCNFFTLFDQASGIC